MNKTQKYYSDGTSSYEYEVVFPYEKDKEYWIENLEDIHEKTILKRKNKTSIAAKRVSIVLPSKLNEKIYDYCKKNRI